MNILVLGWYYSSNLGDAVLCRCTAELIRRRFPDATIEIRDLINRPGFPAPTPVPPEKLRADRRKMRLRIAATRLGWDKQLRHESFCLRQKQQALDQVAEGAWDAVVFAGGQLFMDSLALYVEALVQRFSSRGIPMFFQACGTGPAYSPQIRHRLGLALSNPLVRYVSCRDDTALINAWCGRELAVSAADSALWTDSVFCPRKQTASAVIGLGVMFPHSLNPRKTRRFWLRLIRQLEQNGTDWKIFTNGSQNDVTFAREILSCLPQVRAEDHLCPTPRTPEQLAEILAGFHSLISFRLHSHIIAASLDIPSVALVWDGKLRAFFRSLGHEERCLTVSASPGQVLSALKRAQDEGLPRPLLEQMRNQSAAALGDALAQVLQDHQ